MIRARFSKTELEVLLLLMQGLTVREIAEQRGITINTIDEHLRNLRGKTGTKTLFELGYKTGRDLLAAAFGRSREKND